MADLGDISATPHVTIWYYSLDVPQLTYPDISRASPPLSLVTASLGTRAYAWAG